MLDKEFTKKSMFILLVIGIVWIPIVLLSPIPNLFMGMSVYFIGLGGTMYGLIKREEYLDRKGD